MQSTLFAGNAQPVTPRWVDPGDAPKKRTKVNREAPAPPPPREHKRTTDRRNNYREVIADPFETEFRHQNWQQQRERVQQVLANAGTPATTMSRFANCGGECLIEWSESAQRYRLRASYCRSRHCKPCMRAKQMLLAQNLRHKLEATPANRADRYRFVTLTLKHSAAPLADQIADLYRHFRVLRRSRLWKQTQVGGAATFECKYGPTKADPDGPKSWHPHLHIIAEGTFIAQDKLAAEWMRLTNGSFKVDVRKIAGPKDAANYVAKYAGKGSDDSVWTDDNAAQEWVIATKGLRTAATFGSWRGYALLKRAAVEDVKDWKPVGLLARVVRNALAGSIADANLLYLLENALQYDPRRRGKRDTTTPGGT